MVTYESLRDNQRCIYQAFTRAVPGVSASTMGKKVNEKGVDADDNAALVILSELYGFGAKYAFTGGRYHKNQKETEIRFDTGEKIILVITSGNHAANAEREFGDFQASPLDILACKKPHIDNIEWHAIYGVGNSSGGADWQDQQNQRPQGPWPKDYVLYFSDH